MIYYVQRSYHICYGTITGYTKWNLTEQHSDVGHFLTMALKRGIPYSQRLKKCQVYLTLKSALRSSAKALMQSPWLYFDDIYALLLLLLLLILCLCVGYPANSWTEVFLVCTTIRFKKCLLCRHFLISSYIVFDCHECALSSFIYHIAL